MSKTFVIIGAIFMFLGVSAGAFGAHGLESYFVDHPQLEATYETAVQYQLIHGLALFAIAWAATQWPGALITWAGYFMVLGILIFSGSLYLLVLTDTGWFGAITPVGGVALLSGWAILAVAAWRSNEVAV